MILELVHLMELPSIIFIRAASCFPVWFHSEIDTTNCIRQVVPILRAGLALVEHASVVLPATKTYHLGITISQDQALCI